MRPLATDRPFSCVSCEAEIRATAVFHVGLPFCCAGCVAGGPCLCSYDDDVLAEPGMEPGVEPGQEQGAEHPRGRGSASSPASTPAEVRKRELLAID
jgi:hypothetical protein